MAKDVSSGEEIEIIIAASHANIASFVLFGIAFLIFGLPFIYLWSLKELIQAFISFLSQYLLLGITVVTGVVLHEMLHAITFAFYCKHGWGSVSWGIKWKQLSPYVHCSEALSLFQYRLGTFMPGLVLGILPCLIGIVTGYGWALIFGLFFTAGSAGDLLSLIKLLDIDNNVTVKDHPDEVGFIIKELPR